MDLGPFGFTEMLFIGLLALVVFGPRRLPEIGHAAGRAMARLKRATSELRAAYESELDEESRREIESARQAIREVKGTIESAGRDLWAQGGNAATDVRSAGAQARSELTAPISERPTGSSSVPDASGKAEPPEVAQ